MSQSAGREYSLDGYYSIGDGENSTDKGRHNLFIDSRRYGGIEKRFGLSVDG